MKVIEEPFGNIYRRKWIDLAKGQEIPGHGHNFDHITILFLGSMRVEATLPDGTKIDNTYTAPDEVLIRAGVQHTLTSLKDGTQWWCVFAHRNPDGEVEQESNYLAAYG